MCFKKKTEMQPAKLRLLTFGKNKYPSQSLSGCVNDSKNMVKKFKSLWPEMDCRMFLDAEVTAKNYLENCAKAISLLDPGATVVVISDSCFSESATRLFMKPEKYPTRSRFYNPGLPYRPLVRSSPLHPKEGMKWIAISACRENETAADAYFGRYEGAFTHFALQVLRSGMTYREWYWKIREYLPSAEYGQMPTLEGPDYLLDRVIGKEQTLIPHNSSHGSYTYDQNDDEIDGKDEGLFFDRLLLDDENYEMLSNIN